MQSLDTLYEAADSVELGLLVIADLAGRYI